MNKIWRESKSKQAQPSSSGSSSSAANSGQSGGPASLSGNAFKAFEKQTIDDWDIDNEDDGGDGGGYKAYNNLNEFYFPISVTDSEEMAKRIIRNHQEKHTSPLAKNASFDESPRTSLSPSATSNFLQAFFVRFL